MKNQKSLFQLLFPLAIGASLVCAKAQAGTPEDFVNNLSGCFKVSFRYVEDGKNDQQIEELNEWMAPEKGESQTTIQHYGVVGGHAFKHWSEEWKKLENGTWYQKVIGPFGDFRYECAAKIEFNQWRCSVANAPKPRRDKDRTDYVTLDRENTLQVTPKGWVQSENNVKRDKDGKAIANELGWNEYRRVDDKLCQPAIDLLEKGQQ